MRITLFQVLLDEELKIYLQKLRDSVISSWISDRKSQLPLNGSKHTHFDGKITFDTWWACGSFKQYGEAPRPLQAQSKSI
jgi:hypothetical protein